MTIDVAENKPLMNISNHNITEGVGVDFVVSFNV